MRSLIDWIISSEITGDVYESALYTIISKATADELDREALISTVLEPILHRNGIRCRHNNFRERRLP